MENKNGYAYSRQWFEFIEQTNERITPMHTSLYLWIVELNNRLHWSAVVGLPTNITMSMCSIGSYNCYKKTFDDLIRFGFIDLVSKSCNQWNSNKVALLLRDKANDKAPSKHLHHNKTRRKTFKNNDASEIVSTVEYNHPITNDTR